MGARGRLPVLTKLVRAKVEPALETQIRQSATAAGLGVGPFIRAVLADYVQNPHPLQEESK